ncbi:polysaccharide deacetylase family protein [Clostridium sp. KNHs214]|uniref:polysaccharide deacetylase family protein n=1 Tax=Clostridium sp. KNHs214 TaxID=1540257 RepID=UPI00068F99AB|nr:polysaccharide deacetylase family protein [Clostridium sp. KNHs214]
MKFKNKSFVFKTTVVILLFILFLNGRIAEPFLKIIGKTSRRKGDEACKYSIPILMYHSISDNKNGFFKVDKNKFRKQMQYIKDNGYETLTLDQVYYYISKDKQFPDKAVVITFDDGYKDNYTNAYPILKELDLKATIFVVADYITEGSSTIYSSLKELREMRENGIDIQSHTSKHRKLDKLSYDEQLQDLSLSKAKIEKLINSNVKFLTYPYGRYNNDTIKIAKKCGYEMAVTTHMGYCNIDNESFKVRRICVPGFTSMNIFKRMIY